MRRVAFTTLLLVGLAVALDHLGAFGWRGDDWSRYNRKSLIVARVLCVVCGLAAVETLLKAVQIKVRRS